MQEERDDMFVIQVAIESERNERSLTAPNFYMLMLVIYCYLSVKNK